MFVEIFNKEDIIVGFGDPEPHNTFNITADLSDECRYRDTDDQFLQARGTRALENISTKTGTFHFEIDCPTVVQDDAVCTITAYIESGEVEKEVDFDCYIDNGLSALNFNKMVTSTPYIVDKTFGTEGLGLTFDSHTVTCKANYYNFGSRTDTFSDSFIYKKKGVVATGGVIEKIIEDLKKSIEPIVKKGVEIIKKNAGLSVAMLFLGIFLFHRRDIIIELVQEQRDKKKRRKILRKIFSK